VIFHETPLAEEAHVLIAGIARITCLNATNERVTVALIAPGPIPELPSLLMSRFDFRCEAFNNCRVGTLDWKGFEGVTLNGRESAFKKFHQNDLSIGIDCSGAPPACLTSTSTNASRSQSSIYATTLASKIHAAHY
jgi:hypothetical protein